MKPFTYKEKTVLVARNGNIYFNKKRLNQYNNGTGYMSVNIKRKLFYVHRIVCEVFNGKPLNKRLQANHLNGIRNDNRAVNLRWDTSSDNHKHAYRDLKRVHSRSQLHRSGIKHHNSKPVDQIDPKTGVVINTFYSIYEAARFLGLKGTVAIHQSIKNKEKVKLSGGFRWAYNPDGNKYKPKYIYWFDDGVKKRKLNL